ncbi:hypothetical protein FOA52_003137 [Chlamydomonas sp. UWO 241]|nr:hypothetical protein FOA52_003137 [Chlamydomonas sp. UWO 241]
MPNDDDEQLMWMDEEAGADDGERGTAATNPGRGSAELEGDLLRVRAELAEVRRDLAAKTVQLTRREKVTLDEKVQEIAATVNEERDQQLQQALSQVEQLKLSVSLRGEELEESRRLYAGQKRALREAMNAVAERETVEKDAEESTRTAHAQALEDELDALTHELAMTKARGDMELRAREGELGSLRTQLAGATQRRKQAVAEAEAALTEAWEAEVARLQREAEETATQLDGQLVRLMTQIEDARREDTSSWRVGAPSAGAGAPGGGVRGGGFAVGAAGGRTSTRGDGGEDEHQHPRHKAAPLAEGDIRQRVVPQRHLSGMA